MPNFLLLTIEDKRPKKKSKKDGISRFVEEEASEASSDHEESDYDDDTGREINRDHEN